MHTAVGVIPVTAEETGTDLQLQLFPVGKETLETSQSMFQPVRFLTLFYIVIKDKQARSSVQDEVHVNPWFKLRKQFLLSSASKHVVQGKWFGCMRESGRLSTLKWKSWSELV